MTSKGPGESGAGPRSVAADPAEAALIAAARALTSRLDVAGVCAAVLDAVEAVFGAGASWILLADASATQLRTAAFRGSGAKAYSGLVMPADAGVMGLAFSAQQMVFVPEATEEDRWFDAARVQGAGLRSVFAVPLVQHDRAVGVIGLDSPRFTSECRPDPLDVARLEALAAQAAIAIVNAQLYEASERDRRRLEALLEERRGLRRRVSHLQEEVRAAHGEIVGASRVWTAALAQADLVAPGDTTTLILGETGTGKELVARRIHDNSSRAAGPFVAVNCAALPEALVESELFGHERGAFTGALARKAGKFETASGGTLFLDEVGDLPAEAQAKLLRVLQDSQVQRVGSTQSTPVDVRVIAATNQDLDAAIAGRTFRSDLYYRLSVFPIRLPALRERIDDIPLLAEHFVRVLGKRLRKPAASLSREAAADLQRYHWPGNVRELQNVIERAVILAPNTMIEAETLGLSHAPQATVDCDNDSTLAAADRRAILEALEACGWKVSGAEGAATRLGLKPTTLHAKMKKLGISRAARRP